MTEVITICHLDIGIFTKLSIKLLSKCLINPRSNQLLGTLFRGIFHCNRWAFSADRIVSAKLPHIRVLSSIYLPNQIHVGAGKKANLNVINIAFNYML